MMDYNNPNDYWAHNRYDLYKGMNDDERMAAGCMQMTAFIVMLLVGLAVCALLGSCTTTEYVTVEKVRTDTLIQTKVQKDSVFLHDSTFVKVAGDTVLIER